ncbi:MAG: cyclophilin-like fold protein [Chloroflexota bacterium]|nr:cyclophilin-like fold protein [Chloroflexota bacterium]
MNAITIRCGGLAVPAELGSGPTAHQVWRALPLEGRANIWGDEIYFEIPLVAEQEGDARAEVSVGELGYWPVGRAFCIFFGPTPVSVDEKPRAYSPVNILGRVIGDATLFRIVRNGELVRIEKGAPVGEP